MSEHRSAAGGSGGYQPLPAHVDLPAMDREIIDRWRANKVFQRSLDATAGGEAWTFYEGPPTANGMPGTHHVEARVFKDVFPRFKTMQGYHVARMAGWDCHGLPVELAVEKELGFTGKPDIEALRHRASSTPGAATRCSGTSTPFQAMSERMGYWADYDNAYWTMNPDYVESVWWALKTIFDQGLLVEDYRVTPYCPRCGTGLSDHELGQEGVYTEVVDPAVYVRLPVTSGPEAGRAELVVWTTTPWTLVSNTAVAVNPEVDYVVARTRRWHLRRGRSRSSPLSSETTRRCCATTPAATSPAGTTSARSTMSPIEGAHTTSCWPTTSRPRTARAWSTRHRRSAPTTWRRREPTNCRWSTRSAGDGRFRDDLPDIGGVFFKDADEVLVADAAGERPAATARAVRPLLPALLAVPHPADVLRAAVLVRPHHGDQGPSCSPRTRPPTGIRPRSSTAATGTGWPTTSTGRCPATGTGARRCRSGATTPTRASWSASARWPSCPSSSAATCPTSTRTGRSSTR